MLVAIGPKFAQGTIVNVAYEVSEDEAVYTFDEQPFRILREITKWEYLQALPVKMRRRRILSKHYYEIHTD